MPQLNRPIARPAGLRSLLSPHSMAIIGLSRRVDAIVGGSSLTSSVLAEWKYWLNLLMWVSIRISLLPTFLPACPHFTISYAISTSCQLPKHDGASLTLLVEISFSLPARRRPNRPSHPYQVTQLRMPSQESEVNVVVHSYYITSPLLECYFIAFH